MPSTIQPSFLSTHSHRFAQPSPPQRGLANSEPRDQVRFGSVPFDSAQAKESVSHWADAMKAALGLCLVGTGLVTGGQLVAQSQVVEQTVLMPTRQESLQIKEISPQQTDPAITQARGPHIALVDSRALPNGHLLISLGGTNSLPSDFLPFNEVAAQEGYAVLALDYPNTVITTSCKTSPEPDPCTLFRREIVSGEQVSQLVEVDQANSIENRLESLLRYQAEHDPENFAQFMTESGPAWDKIVIVGHSQGSGHAAFLAKQHPLEGVILLAGPQDTTAAGPASWLSAASATEPEDYLSFLHRDDFFNSGTQLEAVRLLREDPQGAVSVVDYQSPTGPIVMSTAEVRDPHMSVITPQYREIWQGLLQRAIQ